MKTSLCPTSTMEPMSIDHMKKASSLLKTEKDMKCAMKFYFRPPIADFGNITTHGCHCTAAAQAQSTTQNKSGPAAAEPRPQPRPQPVLVCIIPTHCIAEAATMFHLH